MHYTAKFPKHPPQEPGTQHFFLDDDSVLELGGSRPDRHACRVGAAGASPAVHRGAD